MSSAIMNYLEQKMFIQLINYGDLLAYLVLNCRLNDKHKFRVLDAFLKILALVRQIHRDTDEPMDTFNIDR